MRKKAKSIKKEPELSLGPRVGYSILLPKLFDREALLSEDIHISVDQRRAAVFGVRADADVEHFIQPEAVKVKHDVALGALLDAVVVRIIRNTQTDQLILAVDEIGLVLLGEGSKAGVVSGDGIDTGFAFLVHLNLELAAVVKADAQEVAVAPVDERGGVAVDHARVLDGDVGKIGQIEEEDGVGQRDHHGGADVSLVAVKADGLDRLSLGGEIFHLGERFPRIDIDTVKGCAGAGFSARRNGRGYVAARDGLLELGDVGGRDHKHAVGLGQKIVVNSEKNSEDGVFCGLDADGALLLRQNEHIKKIYAGDIFIKKDNTENE